MHVERVDGSIVVRRPDDSKASKSLHGLSQRLIANMVQGVTEGYQKSIEVVGVGYRVQKAGEKLQLQVGLSHLVEVIAPPGVQLVVEGANRIHVQGIDKQLVGETAAQIRRMRPADPYKGKGLRYAGETIRLKAGKTAAKKKA
jgi:large subunit ribosomal protein L6